MEKNTIKVTYNDLAHFVDGHILCNTMQDRYNNTLHLIHGNETDEDDNYYEIMQWFIISEQGANYLEKYTDELVFYDSELDLYVWGITFYGISWDYVPVNISQ